MRYPIKYFENKKNPKLMSADDLKDYINAAIQQQRVNKYINIEAGLRINLENIHGLVWGQCSHGIKSIVCNNKYFEYKSEILDCLWLVEELKEVTLVLDVKSSK